MHLRWRAMPCAYCDSENGPGAKYCQSCGQPLALPAGQAKDPQQVQLRPDAVRTEIEKMLSRRSSGAAWLLVSLGTFVVAFGFLDLVEFSHSTWDSLRIIGYGFVLYAIAAAFVALSRFTKRN
jgi:hypothetical protein